jgi:ligand-binding SRPBCC domain-containing protein
MNFVVLTKMENDEIYEGMNIDYYVSPLFGIKMKWRTKNYSGRLSEEFYRFSGTGPYKLWHHHHEFIPNENGIFMKDTVDYELPLGFLGEIAHTVW